MKRNSDKNVKFYCEKSLECNYFTCEKIWNYSHSKRFIVKGPVDQPATNRTVQNIEKSVVVYILPYLFLPVQFKQDREVVLPGFSDFIISGRLSFNCWRMRCLSFLIRPSWRNFGNAAEKLEWNYSWDTCLKLMRHDVSCFLSFPFRWKRETIINFMSTLISETFLSL